MSDDTTYRLEAKNNGTPVMFGDYSDHRPVFELAKVLAQLDMVTDIVIASRTTSLTERLSRGITPGETYSVEFYDAKANFMRIGESPNRREVTDLAKMITNFGCYKDITLVRREPFVKDRTEIDKANDEFTADLDHAMGLSED